MVLSGLNDKESCYRAISAARSSGKRYRLMGDYINLIRRQVGMTKLDFAVVSDPQENDVSAE